MLKTRQVILAKSLKLERVPYVRKSLAYPLINSSKYLTEITESFETNHPKCLWEMNLFILSHRYEHYRE